MKQKSNIKILGIKIASFLQHLSDSKIQRELQVLKKEMLKCMCCEDSKEIRKVAITNIQMTEETFDELINRTREIDIHLRMTIYTKLIKEKIPLQNKDLSSIYKIAYDGLYSRDEAIRKECVNYLRLNYYNFKETNIVPIENEGLPEEESLEKKKKRFSSPKKQELVQETRTRIIEFFSLFHIENILLYPNLYQMMELLTKEFLYRIVKTEEFAMYLKDFLIYDLQFKSKSSLESHITNEEIFLLRYLASLYQEGLEKHKELEEFFMIIDECFPNACLFVKVLSHFHEKKDLFGFHQALLLAEMLINCDETGRNELLTILKQISLDLRNFSIKIPEFGPNSRSNDLFYPLNEEDLNNSVFSQSHFENAIIRDFEDVMPLIIQIFRRLIGDQNNMFSIQMIEIISEIKEPLHNYAEIHENEDNMQNKLLRNQKEMLSIDSKLEEIDLKLKDMKKNRLKKLEQEFEDLAHKRDYLNKQRLDLLNNSGDIEKSIERMNIRCLQICLGLLQRCRLTLKDPGLSNLLTSFIGPLFKEGNQIIRDKALNCLALWVFHDKSQCIEYFPVFTNIFDSEVINTNPYTILSLKFIFDFLMIYDYPKINGPENLNLTYDLEDLMSLLSKFMFKGDVLIQKLCIEGFCRLLFTHRIEETEKILANLMLIWHNTLLLKKGGFEAVQILSTFFRNYQARSLKNLENVEKALETVINLNISMLLKQFEFNNEFLYYDFIELSTLHNIMKVGIDLMNYAYNRENQNLKDFKESEEKLFFPQEKFFIFACKVLNSRQNSKIIVLLEKVFNYFDFFNNLKSKTQALILKTYIEQVFEKNPELENQKFLMKVMKKLEAFEGLNNEENQEKELENEQIKVIITEIEAGFKDGKALINKYCRNLMDYGLVIKRRENPNENEEENEEEKENANVLMGLEDLDLGKTEPEEEGEEIENNNNNNKNNKKEDEKKKKGNNRKSNKRKAEDMEKDNKETEKEEKEEKEKKKEEENVMVNKRSTRNKRK